MGTTIGLPWENRYRFGESSWSAFWRTAWDVLFRPGRTFVLMRTFGGIIEPMAFALPPVLLVAALNALAAGFIVGSPFAEARQIKTPGELGALPYSLLIFAGLAAALMLAIFFLSFCCHAAVTFFQANREGLEGTFRVVAYVCGAALVFSALPSVVLTVRKILPPGTLRSSEALFLSAGNVLLAGVGILGLISAVVGIRDVHGSGNSRAAWSCAIGVALLALAGTFVYQGLKGGRGVYRSLYSEEAGAGGAALPLPLPAP